MLFYFGLKRMIKSIEIEDLVYKRNIRFFSATSPPHRSG